jgi:hypothetical protein
MTGETFLMEKTALLHIPARRVFELDDALPHFSRRVCAFLDTIFLVVGKEEGAQSPGTLFFRSFSLRFLLGEL